MKTLILTNKRKIELQDKSSDFLMKDDDVLLRVAYAGVCGSDIHYFKDGKIGDQVVKFPFIIGHEFSGIVEKTGKDVKSLKPGDKVAVDPAISCGICSQCLVGRFHTCDNLLFLGCPGQLDGCYSEFIIMPERNCFYLPENIDLQTGVFVEPLSIGCYAVSFIENKNNTSIAILGSGPIGLSVLLAAKAAGINKIHVTDKIDSRLNLAKDLGANYVGNPDKTDVIHEIDKVNVVIECCGKQEAIDQAVELLVPGGILLLVGIPEENQIHFNISKLRRKEITIQNVRRQNECVPQAIEIANEQIHEIKKIITHIYKPQEAEQAFNTVSDYKDGVIKALIEF